MRTKVVYAGSANWRQDQHQTDDALLRIVDDGVYADYDAYWLEMRERAGYTWAAAGAAGRHSGSVHGIRGVIGPERVWVASLRRRPPRHRERRRRRPGDFRR